MKTLITLLSIVLTLTFVSCEKTPDNSFTYEAEDFIGGWKYEENTDITVTVMSVNQLRYRDRDWKISRLVISDDGLSFTAKKTVNHSTGTYRWEQHFEGMLVSPDEMTLTRTYYHSSKPDGTTTTDFDRIDMTFVR